MNTCATFNSDLFTPFLPEDSQVNPQCYGAELCWWLSKELAQKGIITSYPNFEDWGWFLEYIEGDDEYWICCGNRNGEKNEWQIYIHCKSKGLFGTKKPPIEKVNHVLDTLNQVLEKTPGICNLIWEKEHK